MKISCVQVDGKMPNLALMKLAAYHRAKGDQVILDPDGETDRAYISVIFPKNKARALGIAKLMPCTDIQIGGSGINQLTLPDEIEHTRPAYDLWNINYSMGFTSRGCIRKCGFCIVPDKEGPIHRHACIEEFVDPDHDRLVLLDNNLLAAPNKDEVFVDIIQSGLKVCFCQGLDIRLMNEHNARALANIKYYNLHFTSRYLYFAFDHPSLEVEIREGVKILEDAGIPSHNLMFYMLVGFNTTFEEDMARYKILYEELDVFPFVMVFNGTGNERAKAFARWVNRRLHRHVPWEEYSRNPDIRNPAPKAKNMGNSIISPQNGDNKELKENVNWNQI